MSTLYRKYRPKKFADLVAQDHISEILLAQVDTDNYSHSYLFTGPRGCGKTSTARILAKAICCEHPNKGEPCEHCESCKMIDLDKALDIVEIDAASNRTIDDVRDLKERMSFPPITLKRKIFIIDEVHMLTKEAFNALLKTLEEPPEYAIFILATTDIHKVPPTILSRCQRFDFRLANIVELQDKLSKIAKEEGISLDPAVSELVASMGQGSFRDSESVLEKLIVNLKHGDKIIDISEAYQILGLSDLRTVQEMYNYLRNKDFSASVNILTGVKKSGKSIVQFLEQLLIYARDISSKERFNLASIIILKKLSEIFGELKYHKYPDILFEIALYEICSGDIDNRNNNILNSNVAKTSDQKEADQQITSNNKQDSSESIPSTDNSKIIPGAHLDNNSNMHLDAIKKDWISFIKTIEIQNPNLASFIANSIPLKVDNNNVVLRAKFKIHKDIIDKKNSQQILNDISKSVYGTSLSFTCIFEKLEKTAKVEEVIEINPNNIHVNSDPVSSGGHNMKEEKKLNHSEVFGDMVE